MDEKKTGENYTYNLRLNFADWVKDVPEDKLLVLVSVALNHCVYNHKIKIKGYLITRTTLYLVMTPYEESLKHALDFFSEQIHLRVDAYLKNKDEEDVLQKTSIENTVFIKHQLQDYDLIKIITGKDVKLPYHSPRIAYLKKITHNYKYCSVSDYKGVLGPVIVDTIQK